MVTIDPGQPSLLQKRRDRAEAVRWAGRVLASPDIVFLDTETTGIDGGAEIVEVAVVDGQGRTLLDTLVRPDGVIPLEVVRIHGINDAMVVSAPRWPEVYPELMRAIFGRTVIVYNAEFDLRLVNQMNRRAGFLPLHASWECAMRRYAAFSTVWNGKYGNYRYHKLDAALAAFGQLPGGHRARADALACRLVVQGMAAASESV